MTTPSIPDLIAALEEHDKTMTSGPMLTEQPSGGQVVIYRPATSRSREQLLAVCEGTSNAAAIAWFGTHRGALAEALRTVARERDEAVKARDHHENARREAADSARDWMLEGESQRARANKAEDERDEAKREAESLRALLGEVRPHIKAISAVLGRTDAAAVLTNLLARIDLARGKDGTR